MKVAQESIKTGIDDYEHLLRVQQRLSREEAIMRAKRRADIRRATPSKPSFSRATFKPSETKETPADDRPTIIYDYNPFTDKWRTNKGEKYLANRAAPRFGESVLDFGSIIFATPCGEPFPPRPKADVEDEPDKTVAVDVVVGIGGLA